MSKSDKRAVQAVHAVVQATFPRAFPKHYDDLRPLKMGILADLVARLPEIDPRMLGRVLANHTSRDGYLLALVHRRGDMRYNLDGQPTGVVTVEERAEAQKRLEQSQQRQQAKAEQVQTQRVREEERCQQRENERRNREAKAARQVENERRQQAIAAHKAALLAQGITPESRSERKRRLAREAAERTKRKSLQQKPASCLPVEAATVPPSERSQESADSTTEKSMPQVVFRKKRQFVPPSNE